MMLDHIKKKLTARAMRMAKRTPPCTRGPLDGGRRLLHSSKSQKQDLFTVFVLNFCKAGIQISSVSLLSHLQEPLNNIQYFMHTLTLLRYLQIQQVVVVIPYPLFLFIRNAWKLNQMNIINDQSNTIIFLGGFLKDTKCLTIVSAVHLEVLISFFLWEKLLSLIDTQDCRTTEALDGLLIYLPEKLNN